MPATGDSPSSSTPGSADGDGVTSSASRDNLNCLRTSGSSASIYELPPIFVASTDTAYNGEQRVRIVLAQFPGYADYPVIKVPHVRTVYQVEGVVRRAKSHGSVVVHTLIVDELRQHMAQFAEAQGVQHIDLTGPLIRGLADFVGQHPVQEPGLYWTMHRDEFDRITAIEFTLAHDDGRRPEDWHLADIVLLGPSRSGKTPLSVYLGVMGYKVANIPLVAGMEPSPHLMKVAKGRVVGLNIDPQTLQAHRCTRQTGVSGTSYTDAESIYDEARAGPAAIPCTAYSQVWRGVASYIVLCTAAEYLPCARRQDLLWLVRQCLCLDCFCQ